MPVTTVSWRPRISARAGLRTLVLERRDTVGGAAITSELAPGVRVPTLAHTVGRLRPSVVRDLELRRFGLSLVAPEVRAFAPALDGVGRHAVGRRRPDRGRFAGACRVTMPRPIRSSIDLVRALSGFLGDLAGRTPPDIESPGLGDALAGLQLGRTFRGLGREDGHTITRALPMAVADFVAESLENDALRAAIAWRGVQYTAMGPWSAGTTAVLLTESAGNDGGAAGQTVVRARRAWGAVSRSRGVRTRRGRRDPDRRSGRLDRVEGRPCDRRRPGVGRGDPRTGRRLWHRPETDPDGFGRPRRSRSEPAVAGRETSGRRARSPRSISRSRRFPRSPPRVTTPTLLRGRILVAPGIDAMERAHDAAKFGRLGDEPILEATIPSLVDPSLVDGAQPGTHVMSVIVGAVPYGLRERHVGRPAGDARRSRRRDARRARAWAGRIRHRPAGHHAARPRARFRADRRSTRCTASTASTSSILWRPLLGHARYRLGLEGLYLAGAGSHPGGGVTGWNGQNAAREIVADLRRRRR